MIESDPFSNFKLPPDRVSGLLAHFERRRGRAEKRLSDGIEHGWYFGIIGLEMHTASFDFAGHPIVLEEVEEPPSEVELARALTNPALFGAISRYAGRIRHQLRILKCDDDDQAHFNLAWWLISLLRVRTLAEFLVPAVSDHSWSVIAALKKNTCNVQFVEDVPTAKRLASSSPVADSDLKWVGENLLQFAQLLEIPSFRLAVESMATHQHQANDRMMVAMLWSGIESLFSIQIELSFRLATFVATALESPGERRRDLYRRMKKLYGVRSKAVHGSKLSVQNIHEHVVEVRQILSRLLCSFIEIGKVPSEDEIENWLFGVSEESGATSTCNSEKSFGKHG